MGRIETAMEEAVSAPYVIRQNSFGSKEVTARVSGRYLGWVDATDSSWWEATCGDIFCGWTTRYTTRKSVADLLWQHYRNKHGGSA